MEVIDIHSKGEYPRDVLSNFYPNSFVLDGVECASMEGFLQSLKYRSKRKQRKVCTLSGGQAKDAGSKKFMWKWTGNLYWQGRRYKRTSQEFDDLRRRAYEALFTNQTFRDALLSAKGKLLTHTIGKHDKKVTILTVEEFIGYLNALTQKL